MRPTLLIGLALFLGIASPVRAQNADARLGAFFKAHLDEAFRMQPLQATLLGDHRFDHLLDDISAKARAGWLVHTRKQLAALPKAVKRSDLSRDRQVDYDIFRDELVRNLWLDENTRPFEEDPTKPGDKIGPEFTFGLTLDAALDQPILIIKAAWGGKSLHTDFRSPSGGPYELSSFQLENYPKQEGHGIPKDLAQWKVDKAKATGHYYRLMMEHVKKVLGDVKRVCPDYDAAQGYELGGFVWLQGFNDMVESHVYPGHNKPDRFALYSDLLAHFIRDVRKDLAAPKLPFVIGVMGVGGLKDDSASMLAFRQAMAAPAGMPEFKGNVIAVQTAPFWSAELGAIADKREKVNQMRHAINSKNKNAANADGQMTDAQKQEYLKKFEADLISPQEAATWKRGASNAGYHYLGCAKTLALMGKAFAEANLQLLKQ